MSLSRKNPGRPLLTFCVLVALVAGLSAGSSSAEAADFCDTEKIHDYAKPLKRLPRIPAPPFDGPLDFAPSRTFIGLYSPGPLQVGPGKRGIALNFSPYEESPKPSRRLDWQITSRLVKLDRSGRRIGNPREIEKHVKRLWPDSEKYHGLDFSFDVPGRPASYRYEISFSNSGSRRLARFGENFRVLKPSLDVDLVLNGTTFRRGEAVRAWLVNRGVAFLGFGLGETIEYWDGTIWTAPPVSFPGSGKPVPAIGLSAGPGEKTSCWETTIPANAVPGTYRFGKNVDYSTSAPFNHPSTPLDLSAEFTVTE